MGLWRKVVWIFVFVIGSDVVGARLGAEVGVVGGNRKESEGPVGVWHKVVGILVLVSAGGRGCEVQGGRVGAMLARNRSQMENAGQQISNLGRRHRRQTLHTLLHYCM